MLRRTANVCRITSLEGRLSGPGEIGGAAGLCPSSTTPASYNFPKHRDGGHPLGEVVIQHCFTQLSKELDNAFLQKHKTRRDTHSREVTSCSQKASKMSIKRRAE